MENTKLINVLKTFTKQDVIKFREFVSSPFYNKNQKVIALCEEVLKFYPEFNKEECTDAKIFRKMFGNEKFNYFKIKNIISDLYQLSVLYLQHLSIEKKGMENEVNLLYELHERKLDTLYNQKEKQIKSKLLKISVKDEYYLRTEYQLARANTTHYKFKKSGYTFDLIQNEFDAYLQYALIVLLQTYAKMLTNSNHGNIKFNMEMFDNVIEYVKDKEFENNPSSRIYKQIISLELTKDEKVYRKLFELKEKFNDSLSLEDIYYILLVANSFAAYRLRLGDESYYKDRFRIFKEIIDRKIQPENYILFVNFISNYTSACMVDEFEWADEFMTRFQNGISPEEERSNTINYCLGFKAYKTGNFNMALECFSKTHFKLFLTKVMVKSYTLRILYEKNLIEQTFSAIDNFRHYLKSEKLIAEDLKEAHYEFLKYIAELTNLKSEGIKDKKNPDLQILRKQISGMKSNPLGAKNWLIEKAEKFFHNKN